MFSSFPSGICITVSAIWLVISILITGTLGDHSSQPMSEEERLNLKEEAKEMFYHAYTAYMDNAYPADELMPLSCRGRYRDSEPSRGDIDETLGNFSLTLVDSLDTLVVMGDIEEFDRALRLVVRDVTFDADVVVSVFETNIRMVGGLISGHVMAEHLNQLYGALGWYRGELLTMATDIATRLLPAFNTTTGIPHPKVNLKYGMKSPKLQTSRDTCTSCAGTIILEFAALSRLTGNSIFEDKARQAMDCLWSQRHRGSDLVGTVLNVHSGDWVRRDSGVGAGIDSYYEYLLKAYVLLGDEGYLDRFNKHYSAIMKYISQGPMLVDVHMHRPHTTSRNFMDALLAFWPGLQVLKGDIKPAIETHEMLYQVIQRHNFLPEAFTTDFQVHWGGHPLRPEFLESTYLLYQATDDPYYLRVGEQVLRSLQKHAWVPCGYAAVKDVRTGVHEDRMDSFVLSETFKYLYLLFAKPHELIIDMDQFIFTTEAHLLPLSLARLSNLTVVPGPDYQDNAQDSDVEYARSCPNAHFLFPGHHEFAETIRRPLKNFVNNVCPSRRTMHRKLRASEFQAGNSGHMKLLRDMGITIMALPDGRVQLLHTSSNSKSAEDAEEGLLFMQEMIELSKLQQEQPENPPRMVVFEHNQSVTTIQAGPAQFGLDLKDNVKINGPVVKGNPFRACGEMENSEDIKGKIVIMERGDCMFIEKARRLEALGAIGGIVLDNTPGTTSSSSPMFAMSGDGTDDVNIPLVFLFSGDAEVLLKALQENPGLEVVLSDFGDKDIYYKGCCIYIEYLETEVFYTHFTGKIWINMLKTVQVDQCYNYFPDHTDIYNDDLDDDDDDDDDYDDEESESEMNVNFNIGSKFIMDKSIHEAAPNLFQENLEFKFINTDKKIDIVDEPNNLISSLQKGEKIKLEEALNSFHKHIEAEYNKRKKKIFPFDENNKRALKFAVNKITEKLAESLNSLELIEKQLNIGNENNKIHIGILDSKDDQNIIGILDSKDYQNKIDILDSKDYQNKIITSSSSNGNIKDTGKGTVEEVQVQIEDLVEKKETLALDTNDEGDVGVTVPTVRSMINNKKFLNEDNFSEDDLITSLDGKMNTQQAHYLKKYAAQMDYQNNLLKNLEDAQTAEEILFAAVRYLDARQMQDKPSDAAVFELQQLLLKKTASNPELLQSFLNVQLGGLLEALPQKSSSTSSPTSPLVDSSLHTILTHLSTLTLNSRKTAMEKIMEKSPAIENEEVDIKKKELDDLTNKIKEKMKKLKVKYGGLIHQHVDDFMDDNNNEDVTSSETKDHTKDEL